MEPRQRFDFFTIVETATDSAWVIDADQRILYVNPAATLLTGYSESELVGSSLSRILPDDIRRIHGPMVMAFAKHQGESAIMGKAREFTIVSKSGVIIPIELKAFELPPDRGGRKLFAAFISDNRKRKQLEDELRRLAETDGLTGALNRRGFLNLLQEETDRASRYDRSLSVLMIDVDRFKSFNDRLGHAAGDRILKEALRCWQQTLRSSDTIGRLGGDEFGVILPETGYDEAVKTSQRLRNVLACQSFGFVTGNDRVTASIGCAQLAKSETVEDLLARADAGLYRAKRGGHKGRVAVA